MPESRLQRTRDAYQGRMAGQLNAKQHIVTCALCREEKAMARPDAKFCSNACKQAAWRIARQLVDARPEAEKQSRLRELIERQRRCVEPFNPVKGVGRG